MVSCSEHGEQEETFVCQHLAASLKSKEVVGYFSSASIPEKLRPDAWCIDCEGFVQESESGEWDAESESFAGITLLCGCCYDKAKQINDIFK